MANEKKLVTFDKIHRYHNKLSQVVNTKQDSLVSGSNIKTINGQPILGDGNITIEEANVKVSDPDVVIDDIVTSKYIINTTEDDIMLTNYDYYRKTNVSSSISVSFETISTDIVTNYCLEFKTAETGTTVTLPNTIQWANGILPIFENGYTYQISVVNGFGICAKFK
jgi:hypothetical protein